MSTERHGAVTLKGNPLTLVGPELKVGDRVPAFTLKANDMSDFKSDALKGKPALISTILSVSTSICDAEIKRFNEEAGKLGDQVNFLTVSLDLPFTQNNWCGAAGVKNVKAYSDHFDTSFSVAYGTLVKELRVSSRAIFVADKDGVLQYVEYVPEIGAHPDYDKAIEAVKKLA